ncbi:MAG: PIG-L family deacetylase [Myxococcota bacterium]|jgi:LmbE family N-acetylglucosaminyl deacetylase
MFTTEAYRRGERFKAGSCGYRKPLFLIAHQDDELNYGGLIQRLGPATEFVWITNGDGLYFETKLTPEAYGELRMAEAVKAVGAVGIPEANTSFLKFSEIEIYRRMSELYSGKSDMSGNREYFDGMRRSVREALFRAAPDIVFTCAWQGGHPEHDLAHFFTALAVKDYVKETGKNVEFFHLPEYEYTILLAMRFHPLYRGERYRIRLTPEELSGKMRIIDAYPSQVRLFDEFRKVFGYIGLAGHVTGGPKNAEEYLSSEEFGPVPAGIDYTRKPHLFDYFTYMFDDFEGVPVTFTRSILPIVKAFV